MTGAGAIRQVSRAAAPAVTSIITLAFVRDPPTRFWFSEAREYLHWWPRFVMAIGERGFDHASVDLIDGCAAAMWLPPGIESDPAAVAAIWQDEPEHIDTGAPPPNDPDYDPDALSERLRAEMARFHPAEPHWYLWMLGTDPCHQGQGHAARLLEHRLAIIDAAGEPAYLEASNPGLVPFYSRFGFEQVGIIDVAPVPPMFPMLRQPRRARQS